MALFVFREVEEIENLNLHGRRTIYSCVSEITSDNICEVLQKAYAVHLENRREINYLHKYLKGEQPILERIKEIRPEINNKVVENHALEINNFKVGFMFGEPVQYVRRGDCNLAASDDSKGVAALNELMQFDDKSGKDRELAEWFNVCGVGYRIITPTDENGESPFETYVLDPRNTFIVRSNDFRKKPVLGVTYTSFIGIDNRNYNKATVYSEERIWKIEFGGGKYETVKEEINPLGMIPIIEYRNNPDMIGSFECVLPLCDSINALVSNSLDAVEQTVQHLIWFNNCEITGDDFKKLKDMGLIETKSANGAQVSIQVIKTDLDLNETQELKDAIYQTMLTIASVPDRRASAGGNTGQALIIGEGWVMAESTAKALEPIFIASEKQLLKAALKICADTKNAPPEIKKLRLHDIDVKFTRNKTDNLLVKTQALMNLLQSGIHPRIAIAYCGLFSDPEQVYQDSRETLELAAAENADIGKAVNEISGKADMTGGDPLTDEVLALIDKLNGGGGNGDS